MEKAYGAEREETPFWQKQGENGSQEGKNEEIKYFSIKDMVDLD